MVVAERGWPDLGDDEPNVEAEFALENRILGDLTTSLRIFPVLWTDLGDCNTSVVS